MGAAARGTGLAAGAWFGVGAAATGTGLAAAAR